MTKKLTRTDILRKIQFAKNKIDNIMEFIDQKYKPVDIKLLLTQLKNELDYLERNI